MEANMKKRAENKQALEIFSRAPVPKAVLKNAVPAKDYSHSHR